MTFATEWARSPDQLMKIWSLSISREYTIRAGAAGTQTRVGVCIAVKRSDLLARLEHRY